MLILASLLTPPSVISAGVVDRTMDKIIDMALPDADQSSRTIAKEAAKSTMTLGETSDRHWNNATGEINRSFGEQGGAAASAPSVTPEHPAPVRVASATGTVTCPVDGERFSADYAFCPKHGKKLVAAGGRGSETDRVTGMEFVWVDGGCFTMGDDRSKEEDERPAHKACVDGFYMGKFEVTQNQWQKVMGGNPSRFKGGERPVENVSWRDANEFISRLNQQTGKSYRLPTEAEWEFAARGGTQSQGGKYSGSDIVNEVAWFNENSGGSTIPVGRKKPNQLGLYDMSGNVWEWCRDWYDKSYYRWSPSDNPQGPDDGSTRVCRGGCWRHEAALARVALRNYIDPGNRNENLGFRLALPSAQPSGGCPVDDPAAIRSPGIRGKKSRTVRRLVGVMEVAAEGGRAGFSSSEERLVACVIENFQ